MLAADDLLIPGIVYTNSLLASLNARKKIRELSDSIESTNGSIKFSNSLGKKKTKKISSIRVGLVVLSQVCFVLM
jgi:hypothetical protein